MSYPTKRTETDELQQQIAAHGELPEDIRKKIQYKFRLDWNYYSNSMEGNTLTMDETRSVMVGNLTVGGKPLKDVLEVKGHDVVITEILRIGRGEVRLSEKRIKEIHKAIMYEDSETEKAKIGRWKPENNYVLNYKDERFDYVPYTEVAERMHRLLDRTNAAIDAVRQGKKGAPHPVDIALEFHLEYVHIHPFYDGNGRTARILTNLLLIAFGYPPFWITTTERETYYRYLADIQAYGGAPDLFMEFAAGLIVRSQQLVLDAVAGKDIQEPGDLDKKISLLEKELEAVDENEEVKEQLTMGLFTRILNTWVKSLLLKLIPEVQKFNKFFTDTAHSIYLGNSGGRVLFVNENAQAVFDELYDNFQVNKSNFRPTAESLSVNLFYGTFIKGGLNTFGCNYSLQIKFEQIKYVIYVDQFAEENQRKQIKLYEILIHKPLSEVEIAKVVKNLTETVYEHIDFHTKKIGLR